MSSQTKHLLRQRRKMRDQISQCSEMIQGSLVLIKRSCGRSNCRCQKGFKHPALYLSKGLKGRTSMSYVPSECRKKVSQSIGQYKRMLIRSLSILLQPFGITPGEIEEQAQDHLQLKITEYIRGIPSGGANRPSPLDPRVMRPVIH